MADREFNDGARPVVLARHLSKCELCEHRIVPDEEITSVEGEWVHVDCADDYDRNGGG